MASSRGNGKQEPAQAVDGGKPLSKPETKSLPAGEFTLNVLQLNAEAPSEQQIPSFHVFTQQ